MRIEHKVSAIIIIVIIIYMILQTIAYANTNDQIADAIYKAEGIHSKYPYGILGHWHKPAREICINTIKHAMKDWNGQGDFIVFLGSRYCPVNCNNDNGTNKYWVKNVKYFLLKGGK